MMLVGFEYFILSVTVEHRNLGGGLSPVLSHGDWKIPSLSRKKKKHLKIPVCSKFNRVSWTLSD